MFEENKLHQTMPNASLVTFEGEVITGLFLIIARLLRAGIVDMRQEYWLVTEKQRQEIQATGIPV